VLASGRPWLRSGALTLSVEYVQQEVREHGTRVGYSIWKARGAASAWNRRQVWAVAVVLIGRSAGSIHQHGHKWTVILNTERMPPVRLPSGPSDFPKRRLLSLSRDRFVRFRSRQLPNCGVLEQGGARRAPTVRTEHRRSTAPVEGDGRTRNRPKMNASACRCRTKTQARLRPAQRWVGAGWLQGRNDPSR
jgi:hypothetical protein